MVQQDSYRQHISAQFNAELEGVKNHLLEMGGKVEQQLANGVEAALSLDTGIAEQVVAEDSEVNQMEKAIDDECSRILARRQPAASDLRLVLAVAKITTDLERIGDEASKIARQAIRLSEQAQSPSNFVELRHIGGYVSGMLRGALDAFARLDVDMALSVLREDTTVDGEYSSAMRSLVTFMMEDPRNISPVLDEMWALRSLERVGDHSANIAEQVIYLVQGLDARHVDLEQLQDQVEGRS
ncbi:MAG: phosphate signaling complex protein PhoU [Pseudomonadota bacterium]